MKDSDYVKINVVNPVDLIIDKLDGYIECNSTEEKNGNKYLIFASTDKNKEVVTKYIQLWDEVKYMIKTKHGGEAWKRLWTRFHENEIQFR